MSEQTDSSPDKASQEENGWNFISLADFLAVGLENPILGCRTINCSNLSLEYQSATKVARDIGDEQAGCVFALLADLCDMHFKPQDRAKPYGPLFSCGDNRSLIPSDLPSEQSMVLAELALHIINSGLRARLADVAWYNERRLVHCARTAIDAYVEGVRRVMDGSAVLDEDDDPNDPRLVDMLRRACSIARSTGWDRVENDALRVTVCDLREKAAGGLPFPFSKIAGLDLEHGITPAEELARQIEQVAARLPSDGVPWTGKELWGLAAKAFHKARDEENWRRCRLEMANSFVRWAERPSLSAMLAASWYEEAIGALHGVPNVKERRQELQQRMVERQRDIRYEMGTVSHSVDISDLVSSVRKELSGLSLPEGLKRFALLAKSPDPQELEQNALDLAMKHPLQSLFAVQMLDREGKVRSKSSAADFRNGPDANGLRHQIVRHEELRHQMIAVAMIEPARWLLHTEQRLDTHDLIPLVTLSPFVPHGHEMI
ncbi:MAG: hypothetical protein KDG89_17950, partial [Geminicoccaceae bacterium]|nr:hypothetical protein [Geminicoccaceae bacterium]